MCYKEERTKHQKAMARLQQELADVKAKLQAFETQEAQKKRKQLKNKRARERRKQKRELQKQEQEERRKQYQKEQEERKTPQKEQEEHKPVKNQKVCDCLTVAEVLMQYPKRLKNLWDGLLGTSLKRTGTATFEGVKHIAAKIIELNLSNLNLETKLWKICL